MSDANGEFQLLGKVEDETRLLVHTSGYAIAIPGHPELVTPTSDSPRYDVLVKMKDADVELGFRMDDLPTQIQPRELVAALVTTYAQSRAANPDSVGQEWINGRPLPTGANAALSANYLLRDDDNGMEFLEIVVKKNGVGRMDALHLTVRYQRGEMTPFAWSNLRTALIHHQSWDGDSPPSTSVWPERSVFVPRSVRFELSDAAMRDAQDKAGAIKGLLPGDGEKLARVLLSWTNRNVPPSALLPDSVQAEIAREIVTCLPSHATEILFRNYHEVESLHDFRGWLWQQFWAVMNRAELHETN